MAYNTALPPRLLVESIDNVVPAVWLYSGTDSDATVLAAGYISNAKTLGMKVGDILIYLLTSGPTIYIHVVTVVATTGATLGSTPATSS